MKYRDTRLKNNALSYLIMAFMFVSIIFQLFMNILSFANGGAYNTVLFINTYLLFLFIILYILNLGINRHFLLLCFYVCMFTFLMGQKFFIVMEGGAIDEFLTFTLLKLTNDEYLTFINLLYFALTGSFFGYFIFIPKRAVNYRDSEHKADALKKMAQMRNVLKVLYVITFCCALIMQTKIIMTKSDLSYTDGYLVNVDINPIIKIGNYLFIGIAFLYLSCNPKKNEMIVVLISFMLVEGLIQLFGGRRALLAQLILFLFWYVICYLKADEKKIKLKHVLYIAFAAILLVILFYFVEILRSDGSEGKGSFLGIFKQFFISTGGSDSVIANTIRHKNDLPKNGIVYLFSPLNDAVFDNVLVRKLISLFSGREYVSVAQGITYLEQHDSLAHWLSYIVNPELYLKGYGMGSSYIAEVYLAFGSFGVLIFSFLLGMLIRKIGSMTNEDDRIFAKAIKMFLVYNLFMLPRGSVFASSTDFLYLLAALAIAKIIYSIVYMSAKNRNYGVKHERVS